jgi:hypothetical protein
VLTGIIGARRVWTVSMISALSIPWRYLQGQGVAGIPLPPLEVEVGGIASGGPKRKPVGVPKIVGEDAPRTSVPARRAGR